MLALRLELRDVEARGRGNDPLVCFFTSPSLDFVFCFSSFSDEQLEIRRFSRDMLVQAEGVSFAGIVGLKTFSMAREHAVGQNDEKG